MNLYRSTLNIPGCPRGETAEFPDTPRTAIMVSQGILRPVVPSILERAEPEALFIGSGTITGDGSGHALPPFDGTERWADGVPDPVEIPLD